MEDRVNRIEQRLRDVEDGLNEMKEFFVGTLDKPGLKSKIDSTSETVVLIKDSLDILKRDVRTLHDDRSKVTGIIITVGVVAGFFGWLISVLTKVMH